MNREKLVSTIRRFRHFIDASLGLNYEKFNLTGFELSLPLLTASSHNTYLETISDKADTIYLRVKDAISEMITYSYLESINRLSKQFDWKNRKIVLAFDYTDENFYGEVNGFDIHGSPKGNGISGTFKFLTCSIVSDEIPEKIPLLSIPIGLGHYKSYAITHCLKLVKDFIGDIDLILFDRGYYDKDLMFELSQNNYPYLIFVPKHKDKLEILYPMEKGEQIPIYNDFTVNKNKSNYSGENFMIFLKQIYDKKSNNEYDWVFVTNVKEVALSKIIPTYKKRWRIETGFRVQDEARIKCKSRDMKIRYFIFMCEQFLQSQWMCFFKEEVSFKKFIIELQRVCETIVHNPKRSYKRNLKARPSRISD